MVVERGIMVFMDSVVITRCHTAGVCSLLENGWWWKWRGKIGHFRQHGRRSRLIAAFWYLGKAFLLELEPTSLE